MRIQRRQLLGTVAALAHSPMPSYAQAQRSLVVHVGPFSGTTSVEAKELNAGLAAGLKTSPSSASGVKNPTLLTLDDHSDPQEFLRLINQDEVRNALCLVAPQGAAIVDTLLRSSWMDRNDVLVINPIPGADAFRQPGHPRLLHIRASDGTQIRKVVQHARTIGLSALCVVTHDDHSPAGEQAWEAAKAAAVTFEGIRLQRVHTTAEAPSLARLPSQLAIGTQGVLAVGAPDFMAKVLGAVGHFSPGMARYALSYLSAGAATAMLGEQARGIAVAQVYPNPRRAVKPLLAKFNSAMLRQFPAMTKPSVNALEGFIIAQVIAEGLRRSHAAQPAELLASLRARPIELEGFTVDFSQGNSGSRLVEMGVIGPAGEMVN